MSERRTAVDLIWWLILIGFSISILFPLIWILYQSLKTNREFFQDVWQLPEVWKWLNYAKAWDKFHVGTAVLNTVYYVGLSLIISLTLTSLNAYALTRIQFKGRKLIWGVIMLSLFLPGLTALIPQYVLMRELNLTNSLTGLVILDSFGESAFYLLLLGGFMQSLPKELEEGAFMDGASLYRVFLQIIVPLSMPGIVTVAIFKFLELYNNFLGPFIYLSDQSKYTMAVNMYHANSTMQYSADWVTLFAGVLITMAPSVLCYIWFQRSIMEGATLGAVKG
ncbi:carbohydrate ABC transporter permease [Paenibacillus contaminans]|uniref:Carbohydrate ABC transporter permease n=1 Tax=Paenibacillus contaminans TaxID=450362 RepID=A0A329MHJ8_9BACL|nr:carbohydrate ABC transporter permease [Paenibacillus contaminans]RAV19162.1 carbohydrate ABC transporter permease [Paenibacillus contaminans]